jgi:peptidyl-prolyl cis-trans isomerase C
MNRGCGSNGGCACNGKAAGTQELATARSPLRHERLAAQENIGADALSEAASFSAAGGRPDRAEEVAELAHINGVPLQRADESIDAASLRQRACIELLRQAAQAAGLLAEHDLPALDGAPSEEACDAIEALIERELSLPEPSEEACRRHYLAHPARYTTGERVNARHILFAVSPGVNVVALRQRAESVLLDVRCHDGNGARADAAFAAAAREWSNCPSSAVGGNLGWLAAGDCAPELARELFGQAEIGVLPRLVHSRFGLHVVEVLARDAGKAQPFEEVRGAVALALQQQVYVTALRQYLALLAGRARIQGVVLDESATPLVQ